MKRQFIFMWVFILFSSSITNLYAQTQQKNPKIAVMDFVNASGRSEYNYLQRSISENIITTFANSRYVTVVERARLITVMNELKLGLTGLVDESTAAKVGHALGADGIIVGSFTILGDQLRINARLIDVQTIRVEFAKQVTGTNIASLVDEISDLLLIEITPDQSEKNELLKQRNNRINQFQSQFKSPGIAAIGGFLLPIAGHAYVGGNASVIRGIIYTGCGTALMALGIAWDLGDDGLHPFLTGVGINLVSSIDAGISASNHNKRIRTKGFSLNLNPNPMNKTYLMTLSYKF